MAYSLARDIAKQELQRLETHIWDSRIGRGQQSTFARYFALESIVIEQDGQLAGWLDQINNEDQQNALEVEYSLSQEFVYHK